jgi:hypothetical protein
MFQLIKLKEIFPSLLSVGRMLIKFQMWLLIGSAFSLVSCTKEKSQPATNVTVQFYEDALKEMTTKKNSIEKLSLVLQAQEKAQQKQSLRTCSGMLVGDCEKRNLLNAVIDELPNPWEFEKEKCESYRSHLRQQFNPSGEDDSEELTMGFLILDELC